MLKAPQKWVDQRILHPIDLHTAKFVASLASKASRDIVLFTTAQLSFALRNGSSCIDIDEQNNFFHLAGNAPETINLPDRENWARLLGDSGVAGNADDNTPLVVLGSRVYFRRYWDCEHDILQSILRLRTKQTIDSNTLRTFLDRYFPPAAAAAPDWQRIAATLAAIKPFAIICGGPGTGKTTTITKLLSIIFDLAQQAGHRPPVVRMAAPTGKAAARLVDSLSRSIATLGDLASIQLKELALRDASTLHRLLGFNAQNETFRYNASNQLPLDVLIVDETSMIDLPMMARLLDALPTHAKLILVGDKDQLPSVEAGSVLADLTSRANGSYSSETAALLQHLCDVMVPINDYIDPISDSICELKTSHRFHAEGGIGRLANAIKSADVDTIRELTPNYQDIRFIWGAPTSVQSGISFAIENYQHYLQNVLDKKLEPKQLLDLFDKFRALCALRETEAGVTGINAAIEAGLRQRGLIQSRHQWYLGRPIMVLENDYSLQLFNGDIGIALESPANRDLRVYFPDKQGSVRDIAASRLPMHETAFAMTIHKSQGSEFDHVALILPSTSSPLLTRELVFTGVTRAKKSVSIFVPQETFESSLKRVIKRASGLADAIDSIRTI